jgi:hypothetical protein
MIHRHTPAFANKSAEITENSHEPPKLAGLPGRQTVANWSTGPKFRDSLAKNGNRQGIRVVMREFYYCGDAIFGKPQSILRSETQVRSI